MNHTWVDSIGKADINFVAGCWTWLKNAASFPGIELDS
jgi:hypothetical protein